MTWRCRLGIHHRECYIGPCPESAERGADPVATYIVVGCARCGARCSRRLRPTAFRVRWLGPFTSPTLAVGATAELLQRDVAYCEAARAARRRVAFSDGRGGMTVML